MDISLRHEGSVAILTWNDGENRINADSLERLNALLDELEATKGPMSVVLTGVGKFFSNGLDLERFGANPAEFAATKSSDSIKNENCFRWKCDPTFIVSSGNHGRGSCLG